MRLNIIPLYAPSISFQDFIFDVIPEILCTGVCEFNCSKKVGEKEIYVKNSWPESLPYIGTDYTLGSPHNRSLYRFGAGNGANISPGMASTNSVALYSPYISTHRYVIVKVYGRINSAMPGNGYFEIGVAGVPSDSSSFEAQTTHAYSGGHGKVFNFLGFIDTTVGLSSPTSEYKWLSLRDINTTVNEKAFGVHYPISGVKVRPANFNEIKAYQLGWRP